MGTEMLSGGVVSGGRYSGYGILEWEWRFDVVAGGGLRAKSSGVSCRDEVQASTYVRMPG